MKLAIIGGGIGGLTLALALRQVGLEAEIFEQAPELLDVGAAIALWPNALRVLQTLGVGEDVLKKAGVIQQVRWVDHNGKQISQTGLPVSEVPAVALHRADLQATLRRALPENSLHLGHELVSYHQQTDNIQLRFVNHPMRNCEVLIGADGLHSQVRQQLIDDTSPVYRGYMVWRGVTNFSPKEFGTATAIEMHGKGMRFGIGPVGHGRTGWWASANESLIGKAAGDEQQRLKNLFAGWWSPVRQIIEATPKATILCNEAFDRPATASWGIGRITVLGDAIHPMTPNLGQGGCMAIEDAAVLARCLAEDSEPSQGLRRYERARYGRTAALANYSRMYGAIGQWERCPGPWLRRAMLSVVPASLTRRLFRLIFDYDASTVRI